MVKESLDPNFTLKGAEFLDVNQLVSDMNTQISKTLGGSMIDDVNEQKRIVSEIFTRLKEQQTKKEEGSNEKMSVEERISFEEEKLYGAKLVLSLQEEIKTIQTIKKTLPQDKKEVLENIISAIEEEIYVVENNINYIKREQYATIGDKKIFVKGIEKDITDIEKNINGITEILGLHSE